VVKKSVRLAWGGRAKTTVIVAAGPVPVTVSLARGSPMTRELPGKVFTDAGPGVIMVYRCQAPIQG